MFCSVSALIYSYSTFQHFVGVGLIEVYTILVVEGPIVGHAILSDVEGRVVVVVPYPA